MKLSEFIEELNIDNNSNTHLYYDAVYREREKTADMIIFYVTSKGKHRPIIKFRNISVNLVSSKITSEHVKCVSYLTDLCVRKINITYSGNSAVIFMPGENRGIHINVESERIYQVSNGMSIITHMDFDNYKYNDEFRKYSIHSKMYQLKIEIDNLRYMLYDPKK